MTCGDARAMLSELADQTLAAAERATCEAHLAACGDCWREWEAFQRMLTLLHGMPRLRAPAGFADRVLGAVQLPPWHRRLLRGLFVPLPVKLPLEAAALVLVAVGAVYLVQRTPELEQAARGLEQRAPELVQRTPELEQAARPEAPLREETAPRPARESASEPTAERRAPAAVRKEAPMPTREQAAEAPRYAGPERARADKSVEAPKPAAPPEARRNVTGTLARVAAPPTVSGRLVVQDRDAAERALTELAARVGASEVSRRQADEATILELEVPRSAYGAFARALSSLGQWSLDHEPTELPAQVRVALRITR